jgi:type IV pilus assembly protein PilB
MKNEELENAVSDYILEHKLVQPQKLMQAKLITHDSDNLIYEVLYDLNLLSIDELNEVLSAVTGAPVIDPLYEISRVNVPEEVLKSLPNEMVLEHIVFPFRVQDGYLHIAMSNPTDNALVEELETKSGMAIKRYVCYFKTILRAIVRHYSYMEGRDFGSVIQDAVDEVKGERNIVHEESIWTEPLGKALQREIALFTHKDEEKPKEGEIGVSMLIQKIIDYAIFSNASDIHFEPFEDAIKVRLRKDGILATQWYLPKVIQQRLFNRIKVMAKLKSTISNVAQDGNFTYENVVDAGVDIRISTVPTMHGERIALRILDKNRRVINFIDLGMRFKDYELFNQRLLSKQGLILIVGPTGSGKTTTIYASLDQLNQDYCSILTLEDPIEYQMSGICQIPVDNDKHYHFADAFEDVLRQDPDVVVLGEIRETESAQVTVNAASTGHLIFSTLHATCAAFAVPRLLSLGVDSSVMSDVLQLVLAQRLVRVLCPHCKIPDELTNERFKRLGLDRNQIKEGEYYKAVGCDKCDHRGYSGRLGVFEVLIPDEAIRQMILKDKTGLELYRYAMENGMHTMFDDAIEKASTGITSLDEIAANVPTYFNLD